MKSVQVDNNLVKPGHDITGRRHLNGRLDRRFPLLLQFGSFFFDFIESEVTKAIIEKDLRVDGRKLDQIRTLKSEVGILPRIHGSGLFDRGETQILSIVTLGAPFDVQSIETMESDSTKNYFHHYIFQAPL